MCMMALGWGLRYKGNVECLRKPGKWGKGPQTRVLSFLLMLRASGALVFNSIASHGIFGKCLKSLLERELEGSLPFSVLSVPWLRSSHSFFPVRHHCGA